MVDCLLRRRTVGLRCPARRRPRRRLRRRRLRPRPLRHPQGARPRGAAVLVRRLTGVEIFVGVKGAPPTPSAASPASRAADFVAHGAAIAEHAGAVHDGDERVRQQQRPHLLSALLAERDVEVGSADRRGANRRSRTLVACLPSRRAPPPAACRERRREDQTSTASRERCWVLDLVHGVTMRASRSRSDAVRHLPNRPRARVRRRRHVGAAALAVARLLAAPPSPSPHTRKTCRVTTEQMAYDHLARYVRVDVGQPQPEGGPLDCAFECARSRCRRRSRANERAQGMWGHRLMAETYGTQETDAHQGVHLAEGGA